MTPPSVPHAFVTEEISRLSAEILIPHLGYLEILPFLGIPEFFTFSLMCFISSRWWLCGCRPGGGTSASTLGAARRARDFEWRRRCGGGGRAIGGCGAVKGIPRRWMSMAELRECDKWCCFSLVSLERISWEKQIKMFRQCWFTKSPNRNELCRLWKFRGLGI